MILTTTKCLLITNISMSVMSHLIIDSTSMVTEGQQVHLKTSMAIEKGKLADDIVN